jgi:hypothetical protein
MCTAVLEAEKSKAEYRDHCWKYMATIFNGFLSDCGIPQNHVTLLKWNGSNNDESRFSASDGGAYTFPGAAVLGDDGFWRLGVRIFLEPMATISFVFYVGEEGGCPLIRVADRTYKPDLEIADSCNEIYEDVIRRVKDAFSFPKKAKSTGIGFVVESQRA